MDFSLSATSKDASAKADWIEPLARIGYTAKGVVYGLVGLLSLQAAFTAGGDAEGTRGVLRELADQTLGQIVLVLMALGLAGYVIWRFVQALYDPSNKGDDAWGLARRAGILVSGLTYAALAFLALQLVFGSGGGSGSTRQTWTAKLLAQPFGQVLVGLVGAIILGVGLYHFYRAAKATFMEKYKSGEMSARQRRWAKRIGQFGLSARGVTFVLIGVFFVQAALQSDASEAQGLDAALETLSQQSHGPWLLALVALGFVAYGIYCFSRARYRRFLS